MNENLLKLYILAVPFTKIQSDIFSKDCTGQRHKITTSKGKRSLLLKTQKELKSFKIYICSCQNNEK